MKTNKVAKNKIYVLAAIIPIVIILIPITYSLVSYVLAQGATDSEPFLEKPDPEYKECVRDTDYMRYHHWELLRGVREEIVRYGKRGDLSLNKCRECHTSRERFCNRCHDIVSLTPDCFSCHYYP